MTKSRQSADFAAGGPQVAGKNAVINGGMDIWQRGTSTAIGASGSYSPDRWFTAVGGASIVTVSRQVTGDTTNLPNIQYCARVQRNSGATSTTAIQFSQSIETVNSIPLVNQTVTFSFYARRGANYSSTSNALVMQLQTGTGTDQNILVGYTGQAVPIGISQTLTTTWQRFTGTATISTTANEVGVNIYYIPTGTAGANDYFEITGVQLEIGQSATPFSRAGGTIQGELAACQRYYFRATPGSNAYARFGFGRAWSTTTMDIMMPLPVAMRIPPTSVEYANIITSTSNVISSVTLTQPTTTMADFDIASTGLTTDRMYVIMGNNSTSAYIGVSAEL
jgi:hypothetical protein